MPDPRDLDVTIRVAEAADVEALADLMTQLGYETRASEMQMRMEAIRADRNYATFVAVSKGKVCGMIGTYTCYSYEHNSPSGRILALVVSEKMRGRGVGHALIAVAEKDLAQKNISRVAVNTRFERKEAHEFYEKAGYTRNGFRFVKELPMSAD
ncbi:MAG: GNAT family N-acetyltransferase [Verrucomicrobia bacterium]|nr:MAG: GNAT family N-acetyltransferase [Verrucomicrobiota bacterium]PYL93575.1 MAG: GNAT family N-acetyltransferase [Verrucomicrobiota bacterium]